MAFSQWAGVTLPSEVQWEKAARGTDGRTYPWGNQWDAARCNNSGKGTTPVDQYPNGLSTYGCYDMAGNVYEWCSDSQGSLRVYRGGSWNYDAVFCRSAVRYTDVPTYRSFVNGFRLALSPSGVTPEAGQVAEPSGGAESKRNVGNRC